MMISKAFASSVALVLLLSCAPAHGQRGNRPQEVHEPLEELPSSLPIGVESNVTVPAQNNADVEDDDTFNIDICSEGSKKERKRCRRRWFQRDVCLLGAPGEVEKFHIKCSAGGTFLDFYIADGGLPNDHWQLKGKNWDIAPNTAVTTAPGGLFAYSTPGRIYHYEQELSPPSRVPRGINALVECTYLHGINDFPAISSVFFISDSTCTFNKLAKDVRIDRSP